MDNIESKIYNILEVIQPGCSAKIKPADDLFALGVLDSFGMLSYIESLETEFGVQIPTEELIPQNFWSVEASRKTIEKLKNG